MDFNGILMDFNGILMDFIVIQWDIHRKTIGKP